MPLIPYTLTLLQLLQWLPLSGMVADGLEAQRVPTNKIVRSVRINQDDPSINILR